MRTVVYYLSITADGMYAEPDGGLGPFEPSEDEHRYANELMDQAGDMVMGRVMYGVMDYWDELDLEDEGVSPVEAEFARSWRETPKHVVSRGRPELRANATLLQGDVIEALRAMKAGDGPPIMLGGGADLLATVLEAGLVDDMRLMVVPTALGHGKPLFASLTRPLRLRLASSRAFDSGTVLLEYVPEP